MLDKLKCKEAIYLGVENIVQHWLKSRQELIIQFCEFSQAEWSNSEENAEKIALFCQALMDYVSTGHFEVYDQLLNEAKAFDDTLSVTTQEIHAKLTLNASELVKFNDIFASKEVMTLSKTKQLLCQIGEMLDKRFLLEDQLIQILHKSHESEAANLALMIPS